MLRCFIGYDKAETVAYHVLCHSLLRRSSIPLAITPLNREHMKTVFTRPRGPHDSTDFSISRFMVPYLCGYKGTALYMDCDMLALADIGELAIYASALERDAVAVRVVKHDYQAKGNTKFLGKEQTRYAKKNWSSLMLFNCAECTELTPEVVNTADGLYLHQFDWLDDDERIGGLPWELNHLVGEENQCQMWNAKVLHYSMGTPCFAKYASGDAANLWHAEYRDMVSYQRENEYSRPVAEAA